uniref:B3 DNA binding domain-containing protein n=1 Tax=Tanacetum cinerariifolium TaxID=118510 RepID=A0A6L2MLB9_TANCI|nr:B3 DNA binding domain-containing protein [Tanacetum cinerariifolium]
MRETAFVPDLRIEKAVKKERKKVEDKYVWAMVCGLRRKEQYNRNVEERKEQEENEWETEIKDDDAYKEDLLDYEEGDEKVPYSASSIVDHGRLTFLFSKRLQKSLKNSPPSLTAWKNGVELVTAGKTKVNIVDHGRLTFLFSKRLQKSDVGVLKRIVLHIRFEEFSSVSYSLEKWS